jgi:demethylmenaquinone methyltransferase/2-methoxy-6-polyprenyl-1,4-benzoquinol methylase
MPPSELASRSPGAEPSERTVHARRLFAGLPGTYDLMAEVLSFGQNGRWRRFLASRVEDVGTGLDVATGTGHVALELARRSAGSFVGLDQSEPMLREGGRRVARAGLSGRIRLVAGSADRLPFPDGSFDAVTFTYLLRYVDDPGFTLAELARVLRPGGTLANLEFHVPSAPVWRGLWSLYTRGVLPAAGRLVSRSWYEVGRFLGPSISEFYRALPLSSQLDLWRAAGITDVGARAMSLGGGVVIWGRKAHRG